MKVSAPKKVANPPVLHPILIFYYEAFLTLSSCRNVGMGEYRIPWTAARVYADRFDMTHMEFEDFWTLLSAMDATYLSHRNKETKKAEKSAKQPVGTRK